MRKGVQAAEHTQVLYVIMDDDNDYKNKCKLCEVGPRRCTHCKSTNAFDNDDNDNRLPPPSHHIKHFAYQLSEIFADNNYYIIYNVFILAIIIIIIRRRLTKKFPKFSSTRAHTLTRTTVLCFLLVRAVR